LSHFDFVIPILNPDELAFCESIGHALHRQGFSVAFITSMARNHRDLSARWQHVYDLYAFGDRYRAVTHDEIREIEQKYGLVSLEDHVFPEHTYSWSRSPRLLRRRAVHTFRFVERFLSEHSVAAFVNFSGGELLRRSIARVAERGGPTNLFVDFAPFLGRIAIANTEDGALDLGSGELTPEQRAFASSLIADICRTKRAFVPISPLGIGRSNFAHAARVVAATFREGRQTDVSLPKLFGERMLRVARRARTRRHYEKPMAGEDHYFFPLHLINDSVLTIRAPQFQRQEFLVEYIAERLLADGMKLYVKPHLGARDSYPASFIARLARINRVRVIEPTVNAHELILSCRAVIVINSTVGFEALAHKKPVIVVGRPVYRGHGITYDVDNLADLARAIVATRSHVMDGEKLTQFFHRYYARTSPGIYSDASAANADAIATGLVTWANKYGAFKRAPSTTAASIARGG